MIRRRVAPVVKDFNVPCSLNHADINWSRIQLHMERLGCQLPSRCQPSWARSWLDNQNMQSKDMRG
ncbi:hypothetical protein CALVIDRAFT_538522 [Calocera viscosa TUFC12733]|uniref:Uncharacterized protein n=1 Tax=Calocera viscosa (strain TUFC12733) TaxID=1330018 RepID=A0A167KVJ7_CALVF|nr:hypothetical protein CALVIDRAFT_538522 [Calocera viscosa TUFC12733]